MAFVAALAVFVIAADGRIITVPNGKVLGGEIVNHNIPLLGRGGDMSATLVTAPARMDPDKQEAEALLADFSYTPGTRYAEFRQGDSRSGELPVSSREGGPETLVTHPAATVPRMTPAERAEIGIADGLVRISGGLEHVDDLIADLDRALARAG